MNNDTETLGQAIEFLSEIGKYGEFERWLLAKGYTQSEIDAATDV